MSATSFLVCLLEYRLLKRDKLVIDRDRQRYREGKNHPPFPDRAHHKRGSGANQKRKKKASPSRFAVTVTVTVFDHRPAHAYSIHTSSFPHSLSLFPVTAKSMADISPDRLSSGPSLCFSYSTLYHASLACKNGIAYHISQSGSYCT
jgi:hypothetical protein